MHGSLTPPVRGDALSARAGRAYLRVLALRGQLAARAGVGEVLDRDAGDLVQAAARLAQIDVLHDLLRLREADRTARAVDPGLAHRLVQRGLVVEVALHGFEPDAEQ